MSPARETRVGDQRGKLQSSPACAPLDMENPSPLLRGLVPEISHVKGLLNLPVMEALSL